MQGKEIRKGVQGRKGKERGSRKERQEKEGGAKGKATVRVRHKSKGDRGGDGDGRSDGGTVGGLDERPEEGR